MKKKIIILMFFTLICLTGCKNSKNEKLSENVQKMELTGNLVTYEAFYHNVLEYDKPAEVGITHLFEKSRTLFAEYTGIIKIGIDLSKVKITTSGNNINVYIPKAKVIGDANVDKDDFKAENFIESKDSSLNKNPLTVNDSIKAFDDAQKEMKKLTIENEELLSAAQKRAKIILEENIKQLSGLSEKQYKINWEYES